MTNLKMFLVDEVQSAIQKGCSVATINTGGESYTFINLPEPQRSGTSFQCSSYARQKAYELVENRLSHGRA